MFEILIADDDQVFRDVTQIALEHAGYHVCVARDGVQALERARRPGLALAIVDIHMPEKDGLEVILELRQSLPSLRVIAVSAGSSSGHGDHLRTARAFGAHASLQKPISAVVLIDMVERLVGGRPGHSDFRS